MTPDVMERLTAFKADAVRLDRTLRSNTVTEDLREQRRQEARQIIRQMRQHLQALEVVV